MPRVSRHGRSLADVASDLGFSSHSHFSATFRRAFGITPSDLRDRMREPDLAALRSLLAA